MAAPRVALSLAGIVCVGAVHVFFGPASPQASFAIVSVVAMVIVAAVLQHGHRPLALAVLSGLAVGTAAQLSGLAGYIATLIPAAAQAALALLVGRTLLPGRVPAIRRVAEGLHADGSPLPPDIQRYTRGVTWLWCITFAGLAAMDLVVAAGWTWFAQTPAFATVVDLAIVATVLIGEFAYRRQRYAQFTVRDFGEFMRRLRRIDFRLVLLG